VHRYNTKGDIEISETSTPVVENPHSEYTDKPLIFRKKYSRENKLYKKRLDINSQHILKALSKIVAYYPSHPTDFDDTLKVASPYMILYHHWQQLTTYMGTANGEAKMHMKSLLQFLDREIGNDKNEVEKLLKSGYISFPLVWTLFRPGDLVLEIEDSRPRLFRFISGEYGEEFGNKYFKIQLSCTAYNGITTGRLRVERDIQENSMLETSEVTSLSIFPLRFYDEQESVKAALTARGVKYLSLRGNHVHRYKGQLQLLHKPPSDYYSSHSRDYAGIWQPRAVISESQL
jgi:hypothetical protein